MKAYVIIEGGKFETLLFDADEVISYFNENKETDLILEVKTYDVPIDKDNFILVDKKPTDQGQIIHPCMHYTYRGGVCKTWEDCTNPFKDCVNCPLMFSGGGTISSPNYIGPHTNTKDSVLDDSVTVTCTGGTQNSLYQTVTGGCSNFTTKLGSLKDSNPDGLDSIPDNNSVLNDTVKVTYTNE